MLRADMDFARDRTYAIKPDYKPEPEVIDVPIVKNGNWLGCWQDDVRIYLPHGFTHLHCLPSLDGFRGFHENDDEEDDCISLEWIAIHIDEGKNVIARFRRRN